MTLENNSKNGIQNINPPVAPAPGSIKRYRKTSMDKVILNKAAFLCMDERGIIVAIPAYNA